MTILANGSLPDVELLAMRAICLLVSHTHTSDSLSDTHENYWPTDTCHLDSSGLRLTAGLLQLDLNPAAASAFASRDIGSQLCLRLMTIEFIDLAEECIKAVHKMSVRDRTERKVD